MGDRDSSAGPPGANLIVFTTYPANVHILRALEAGARAYRFPRTSSQAPRLLPAAAQRAVQLNHREQLVPSGSSQAQFRIEQIAIGIEGVQ